MFLVINMFKLSTLNFKQNLEMSSSYIRVESFLWSSSALSSSSLQHAKTGSVAVRPSVSEDRALNRREQTCKINKTRSAF